MKSMSVLFLTVVMGVMSISCSQSPERREMTDIERANEFVKGLNYLGKDDDGDERFSNDHALVKAVSLFSEGNSHYVVVLDTQWGRESYFAVDIRNWDNWNTSANDHLGRATRENKAFYNLRTNLNGTFTYIERDGSLGPTFSAHKTSSADVRKVRNAIEAKRTDIIANNLVKIGFRSKEKALDAAKHIYNLNVVMSSKREAPATALDKATEAAFNVSFSKVAQAIRDNDLRAMDEYSELAFKAGVGKSPEHAQAVIYNVLMNN